MTLVGDSLPRDTARSDRVPPPAAGSLWITDAGLETELVFKDGLELPCFSASILLDSADGRARLRRYFAPFVELAHRTGTGLLLETPTWRLSPDWARQLGFDRDDTERIQRVSVELLGAFRDAGPLPRERFVVSGNLGPRYDAYSAEQRMEPDEAVDYHRHQIARFAVDGADVVSALTLPTSDEAIGIARAADLEGIPALISFTVETDGRLPSGEALGAAIARVDDAAPGAVAFYGINCAHPAHFLPALAAGESGWRARIGALRPNASRLSHAELDGSTTLDEGDPEELASHIEALRRLLPGLRVVGGCCGTDLRHVTRLCEACVGLAASAEP